MARYGNLSRGSGIIAYEIGDNSITVEFEKGKVRNYLYTYASAGIDNIEQMKVLAIAGQGLNSFIDRVVRNHYAGKW